MYDHSRHVVLRHVKRMNLLEGEEDAGESSTERCEQDGAVEEKKHSCNVSLFLLILTWSCIAFLYLVASKDEMANNEN